jgi:hypothetical protein
MPRQGFYSIVQFCPDRERLESVNIGIVLFETDEGTLTASPLLDAPLAWARFPAADRDRTRFESTWSGLVSRLTRHRIRTQVDLRAFGSKEAGNLILTPSRSIAFDDARTTARELFQKLVVPVAPVEPVTNVANTFVLPLPQPDPNSGVIGINTCRWRGALVPPLSEPAPTNPAPQNPFLGTRLNIN